MRNPAALSLLLLFAGAAIAQAPAISKVELKECGVYESKVERREDDAQSASGKRTIVQGERLVNETLRLPRGEVSGSQAYRIGEAGYVGYTLRSAERGPWTLEIWVGERKLAEKAFVVAD